MIVIAYDPKSKKVQVAGAQMPESLEAFDSYEFVPDKKYVGGIFEFSKPGSHQSNVQVGLRVYNRVTEQYATIIKVYSDGSGIAIHYDGTPDEELWRFCPNDDTWSYLVIIPAM